MITGGYGAYCGDPFLRLLNLLANQPAEQNPWSSSEQKLDLQSKPHKGDYIGVI